jgi:hypothetical protein
MKGNDPRVTKTKGKDDWPEDDSDKNSQIELTKQNSAKELELVPDIVGMFDRFKYKNVRVHHLFGNKFRVNLYDKSPHAGGRITKSWFVTYTFDGFVESDPPLTMAPVLSKSS